MTKETYFEELDLTIEDKVRDVPREQLIERLQQMPVVDVAEYLKHLPIEELLEVLLKFSVDEQGLIFADFPRELQFQIFTSLPLSKFSKLFSGMNSDDRIDFFRELEPEQQTVLLPFLDKVCREEVLKLSSYPEETAGGIMSTDFATVRIDMTVEQALAKIRKDAPSKKMLYYVYVVDENMVLQGFVSLKRLIMAEPGTKIEEILYRDFVVAYVDEDRESVAFKIEKYDLVAIPVINHQGQLLGIVSHDDAIEVIRAEHTEDMEKFMGIIPQEDDLNYEQTSVWIHFKKRVVWIASLAAVGVISGMIVHRFESAMEKLIILALYMPMVADTGGNAGSQAATVVVRALALGHLSVKDWLKVIWKEFRVSVLIAVCLGIIAFLKILFLSWETTIPAQFSLLAIALTITIALMLQVVTATIIGALIPIVVKAFGGDPAVAASPAITTVVDITGLLIYFGTAVLMLGL